MALKFGNIWRSYRQN